MSSVDELRAAVDLLRAAYDTTRAQLERDFPEPLVVVDTSGRYILLDALTALVNARAALAAGEAS